jgi:hypothetical protein
MSSNSQPPDKTSRRNDSLPNAQETSNPSDSLQQRQDTADQNTSPNPQICKSLPRNRGFLSANIFAIVQTGSNGATPQLDDDELLKGLDAYLAERPFPLGRGSVNFPVGGMDWLDNTERGGGMFDGLFEESEETIYWRGRYNGTSFYSRRSTNGRK